MKHKAYFLKIQPTVSEILNYLIGILMLVSAGCGANRKLAPPVDQMPGYTLVWADEFNGKGAPDSLNWRFENGFVRNEELQWYQSQNAWCENGNLVIEATKEHRANPLYKAGSQGWRTNREYIGYSSSSINTSGKKTWLYGRFEMRGKIDISSGLWPAWWTLGESGKWPANGEIDIMEYYSGKVLANIACLGNNSRPEWHSITKAVDSLGGKKWSAKFHIWRMDWDENSIALYLDDVLLNKTDLDQLNNKDGSGINPFKKPQYMLLDLALGGLNGGSLEGTHFPNRFEVDYVRVYQKK